MVKLSRRMSEIAKLSQGKIVCEIGCDHGKILAYLLEKDIAKKAIFSDISEKCLQKPKAILNEKCLKKSEFICSDGFKHLTTFSNFDEVIIAGIGGKEIVNILKNKQHNLKIMRFILQPNKDVLYLRQQLVELNLKIVEDFIVCDAQKFYPILSLVNGREELSKIELVFGKNCFKQKTKDLKEYLTEQKLKTEKILSKTNRADKQDYLKLINEIEEKIYE